MAARKSNPRDLSPASPASPSSFYPAISAVAVAQICRSVGYTAAEPAAIRSLSAVAAIYLQSLARSAAAIANCKGRTQSNILDLTRAVEDLAVSIGFAGASDPTRPLLRSAVLKDLRSFVRRVKEVPFAKPTRRREGARELWARVSSAASFAEAGREPPGAHVPRWLPCFPENWGSREERKEREAGRRRWEEKGAILEEKKLEIEEEVEEKGVEIGGTRGWEEMKKEGDMVVGRRVKFKLWGENSSERREKRRRLMQDDDGSVLIYGKINVFGKCFAGEENRTEVVCRR